MTEKTLNTNHGSNLGLRGLRAAALAGVAALLVACGGDSDCSSPPAFEGEQVGECDDGGGSSAPRAADLSLSLSAPSVSNTGLDTVTATVTAVDSNRNSVAGIPITLRVDQDATVQVSGTASDSAGKVTGSIGTGSSRSNRVVTVTAISGGISRTATLQVTGTSITGTPVPAVVAPSSSAKIQYRVADASDNGISGASIVITGANGVQSTATTGVSGDYEYVYTAPANPGTLTIRASAGGVENVQNVLVQAGPGAIPEVPAGSVRSASVRANPSVVTANTELSSTNRAEIRALFLGDANAPIENIRVRFDLDGDSASIGGSFTTASNIVYSAANGVATTAYVPGIRFSPTDKVTIRACWDYKDFDEGSCPNSSTKTTLTVISDALSVAIGTDNTISQGTTGLTYVKRYVVQVNDSSGLAKSDILVSPLLDVVSYRKGFWTPGDPWEKQERAVCPNEDLNRNGVSEIYSNGGIEDANQSYNQPAGRPALDPPKASVNVSFEGSPRTNSLGQVVLRIEYPKSYASWVDFNLVVAASGVAGTEGRANFTGILPVLSEDIEDEAVPPPFVLSPFGVEVSGTVFVETPDGLASAMLCTNKN
jgi:hypothetical protein